MLNSQEWILKIKGKHSLFENKMHVGGDVVSNGSIWTLNLPPLAKFICSLVNLQKIMTGGDIRNLTTSFLFVKYTLNEIKFVRVK